MGFLFHLTFPSFTLEPARFRKNRERAGAGGRLIRRKPEDNPVGGSPEIKGSSMSSVPNGMDRRHFLRHMAGFSLMAAPSLQFLNGLAYAQPQMKRDHKSLIVLWMGGGPSHIDTWDMKPGQPTGGSFKPMKTAADGVE